MSQAYLDILDDVLAQGLQGLGSPFVCCQVEHVLSRQQPDGGFAGRLGGSDAYYTDFALRLLALLEPASPAVARARDYVVAGAAAAAAAPQATDTVHCFSLLNAGRLLRRCGRAVDLDAARLAAIAREAARRSPLVAYATFLATLSGQCAGDAAAPEAATLDAIGALQCADGGFAQSVGQGLGHTNATAAAVAVLTMAEALSPERAESARRFLLGMQPPGGDGGGGLRAHAQAGEADLLSTFTGLLTLLGLDALQGIDAAGAARFLRSCAVGSGGFGASPADGEADVEYTYYGLGVMALLRHVAKASR